jgi:hypothetical protein
MPIALILIGGVLIVVAFQNTMGQLAKELMADIPGFFVWIVAIAAILGLGYVPGLKTPSRILLGLVAVVIVLTNYKQIVGGFQKFAGSGGKQEGSDAPDPATAFPSSPKGALPTAAEVQGTASTGSGQAASTGSSGADASNPLAIAGGLAGSIVGGLGGNAGTITNLGASGFGSGLSGGGMDPSSYLGMFELGAALL